MARRERRLIAASGAPTRTGTGKTTGGLTTPRWPTPTMHCPPANNSRADLAAAGWDIVVYAGEDLCGDPPPRSP